MFIGSHISLGGNLKKAYDNAKKEGGNCMQVFLKSPTMKSPAIKVKPIIFTEDPAFKTMVHSSYLLNFSKPPEEHPWAFENIRDDLHFAAQSNIEGCVIHMGKHLKMTPQTAISQYASSVMKILDDWNEMGKAVGEATAETTKAVGSVEPYDISDVKTRLVLENSAAQGTEIGHKWDDIVKIWDEIDESYHDKIGFCFDTCHAFASGYDLRDSVVQDDVLKYIDEHIGIDRLSVIHLNDSKKECGCKADRHENLGKGCIGEKPLCNFVKLLGDKYAFQNPIILETPETGDRCSEINILKSITYE